jgi:dihydrofolate reductase
MISASVDGFVTGPNAGDDNGLGDGGSVLHEWLMSNASWQEWSGASPEGRRDIDAEVFDRGRQGIGAYVMGRGMFGPPEGRWGEQPPFAGSVFVWTRAPRPDVVKGDTTFAFRDTYAAAMAGAREAAGDLDVAVAGGGRTISAAIEAGDLDELLLTTVPVLFGAGTPLFTPGVAAVLERTEVISSPTGVVHTRYRVHR